MPFYKNPLFLGIGVFVVTTIYLYYDARRKRMDLIARSQPSDDIPVTANFRDIIKEISWLIPILTGGLTIFFTKLYFGSKCGINLDIPAEDMDMKETRDDISSFSTDITDASVTYAVPKASQIPKIYTSGIKNENIMTELWHQ